MQGPFGFPGEPGEDGKKGARVCTTFLSILLSNSWRKDQIFLFLLKRKIALNKRNLLKCMLQMTPDFLQEIEK